MPRPRSAKPPLASAVFACRGFTLIELSLVVAILSVVLAFAAPLVRRLLVEARVAAVENDFRVFASAFQSCAQERGDWPAGDGAPAALPSAMSGYINPETWQRRTPLGGHYAWDPNSLHQGSRHRAVIAIVSTPENPVTSDRLQLLALDSRFDDGDLASGSLQIGHRNQPIYILEH